MIGGQNDESILDSDELYDPLEETWEKEDDMHEYRLWHTASTLDDGNLLITGGSIIPSPTGALITAEIYDSTA